MGDEKVEEGERRVAMFVGNLWHLEEVCVTRPNMHVARASREEKHLESPYLGGAETRWRLACQG